MADDMIFMFYTRTLSEDYRVFAGDGSKPGDYEAFEQFERMAQVKSDDEASAVVYEGVGRWYLAVFGLNRKSRDRAGREKRFSFCVSFNGTSIKEKGRAMRAFSRLVDDWDRIGELADSLIQEYETTRPPVNLPDYKGKPRPGEDVRFDWWGFIDELVSKPATVEPPEAGYMLKYFADSGEIVSIGLEEEDDDSGEGYMYRVILALLVGVIAVGWLIWCFMPGKSSSKPPEQPSKSQDAQSSQLENSSGTSQDVTTNNKGAANVENNQAGDNVIVSGDNESHNNDSQGNNDNNLPSAVRDNVPSQGGNGNTEPSGKTQTGNDQERKRDDFSE